LGVKRPGLEAENFPPCSAKDKNTWIVPWLRRLVSGLSLRRPGFNPREIRFGFVVDKVTLGQVSLRAL